MTTDSAALARYLDMFPAWLRTLGEDAGALGGLVAAEGNDEVRRYVTAGLNYIFKSLDLIPDGIDDLGFCDDAFVIRVAAALAVEAEPAAGEGDGILVRLAGEAKSVEDFLGDDYARLVTYVKGLRKGAARGRTVEDIMTDESVRSSFVHEVSAWAGEYQTPSFTRDVKTLIKLKAFLSAKLA
ncbi:MAG: hypothetical protein JWP97_6276 [Labilithrix sp.]|nr:hypothetical protein [Labilithrix sp.]